MNIGYLRTITGMTKKEFAEYFEIPYRTLQNWELKGNGKRKCPKYLLKLIEYKIKKENLDVVSMNDLEITGEAFDQDVKESELDVNEK